MNSPKVSIIIPVYNGEKYLEEAIRSALNQTYKNIEIIVINDGSTDNTEKICLEYKDKIKYYRKENGGVSTVLNMALEKMTGDYFSWLSHDDYYYPNKVEEEVKELIDDNTILMSDYGLIDENGYCYNKVILSHEVVEMHHEFALLKGYINGITLLIPKKAFDECGKFDESLRCGQDYEMWFRMLLKGYKFKHIPKVLASTRIHSNQVTNTSPKVKTEGNQLWINMMKDLPLETKKKMNNTEYSFYKQMVKVLSETPYDEALKYAENKVEELAKKNNKNNDDILVSVIMPIFDESESVLNRSIKSVLNQTHKNWELIIINDNPKVMGKERVEKLLNDNRIIYVENPDNMGASYSRNKGIDIAKGKYIAFLDGDDEFNHEKIERQLKEMELCQENISHTSYTRCEKNESNVINSGKLTEYIYRHCIHNCPIATPTVMVKREFLNTNKIRFNEELEIGEDTCFWLDILTKTSIVGIEEPLTKVYTNELSAAYNYDKQIVGIGNIVNYIENNKTLMHYEFETSIIKEVYADMIKNRDEQNKEEFYPKVSIIIPVYNGEKYIEYAIDSALRQTYKNIEIIVVNDGSTDKTEDICKRYKNTIKYIKKDNGGVSTALNIGIKNMTGDYFSWLSHDDIYFPEKIEFEVNYLKENQLEETNTILYSNYMLIDAEGKETDKIEYDSILLNRDSAYAITKGAIDGLSLLIPRKAFEEVGLFDEKLRCLQDYKLWFEMYKKEYKFHHIPNILVATRVHKDQATNCNPKMKTEGIAFWLDVVNYFNDSEKEKLYGSVYGYYYGLYKFFDEGLFQDVADYCKEKCKKIENNYIDKIQDIKVSVCLAFESDSVGVIDTINSILGQTHKNLELVLVNNCCKDDANLVEYIVDNNKNKIKYIKNTERKDPIDIYNEFINLAQGEFLVFFEQKYIMCNNRIEEQLKKMVASHSIISNMNYCIKSGEKQKIIENAYIEGFMPFQAIGDYIEIPMVMIYKQYLVEKKIKFNHDNRDAEKLCFFIDILKENYMLGIKEPLTIYYGEKESEKKSIDKLNSIIHYVTGVNSKEIYYSNNFIHAIYEYSIIVTKNCYNNNNYMESIHDEELERLQYLQTDECKNVGKYRNLIRKVLLKKEIPSYKLDLYAIKNSRLNRLYRKIKGIKKRGK